MNPSILVNHKMTVYTLDTPFQLPRPDIAVLKTSREDLRHQISGLSDIYLPVLRDTLLALQSELSTVDEAALNTLTVIAPVLENDGLPELLESIVALRGKEASDEVADAIAELTADLKTQIGEGLSKVRDNALVFDNSLSNFSAVTFNEVRFLLEPLEKAAAGLSGDLAVQEKRLGELVVQEETLNKLIADVESISFLDKLLPLIKSLEKLTEIDPKNPLIGSIKAGLEGLKNLLNLANDAIKYEHLIKLRTDLQGQLDTVRSRIRALQEQLAAEGKKLKQLQAVEALDVPKGLYLQEIGKVLEALRRFIDANDAESGEDIVESASRFINHSQVLGGYLNDLRREWRT